MRGKPKIPGEDESVFELELHEQTVINCEKGGGKFIVTKVPSGWIYERKTGTIISATFIPEET